MECIRNKLCEHSFQNEIWGLKVKQKAQIQKIKSTLEGVSLEILKIVARQILNNPTYTSLISSIYLAELQGSYFRINSMPFSESGFKEDESKVREIVSYTIYIAEKKLSH